MPDPASSDHCCFSSGGEFSCLKTNKTEVGEAMQLSRKQKKKSNIKHCEVTEVTSFVTNLLLHRQSTSLGLSKAGNLKRDFMAKKASKLIFFGLNTVLVVIEIPKTQIPCWP